MKTFLADIIPKIKGFSEKLDNLTLLTNQHWVVIDELHNSKYVYIFRSNSELLISQNGKVEKGKWEYLGNNSLLIERKDESFLFRHGFFDSSILALKVDGLDEYSFLVNENNYGGDLNSIDKVLSFLENKYIKILTQNQHVLERIDNLEQKGIIENTYDKDFTIVRNEMGKYGYVDKNGEVLIDFIYDGAYDFSDDLACVFMTENNQDFYGFINKNGDEVIKLKYEYSICFSEGLAVVRMNRMFGYINKMGNIAINIQFDDASSFKNGIAKVKKGSNYFYINLKGENVNFKS